MFMKRLLITTLYFVSAALLCACSATKNNVDGVLDSAPIVVNLTTPSSSATASTPSENLQNRYQLQMVMNSSESESLSFSSKLLLRYTNKTKEPIYSLKFTVSESVSISGVTVNSIATNYSFDKKTSTLTIPVGAELAPNRSMSLYINYNATNISNISDAVLRLCDITEEFNHSVSVTVSDDYSVSSSLSEAQIKDGTNKTYSFSSVSDNNFTLTLN